jgi:hypothetical protein
MKRKNQTMEPLVPLLLGGLNVCIWAGDPRQPEALCVLSSCNNQATQLFKLPNKDSVRALDRIGHVRTCVVRDSI